MDIPSTILFGLLLVWLVGQMFDKYSDMKVESGIAAIVLFVILAVDWFYGHRMLLGNPAGFWRTVLKVLLDFLLVAFVGSGVAATLRSKNIAMVLFNIVWSGGLTVGLLKLMRVW